MSPPLGGQAIAGGVILRLRAPRGKPPGAVRQMVKGNLIKRLVAFDWYSLVTNGTDVESWRHHRLPPPVQFLAAWRDIVQQAVYIPGFFNEPLESIGVLAMVAVG